LRREFNGEFQEAVRSLSANFARRYLLGNPRLLAGYDFSVVLIN
jgi:hypothetical protein